MSTPSSTDVPNSLASLLLLCSPAVPVVSFVAVGPAVDVFYRCYFGPGVPAMAGVSAVAAFPTAVEVSSATDVSWWSLLL